MSFVPVTSTNATATDSRQYMLRCTTSCSPKQYTIGNHAYATLLVQWPETSYSGASRRSKACPPSTRKVRKGNVHRKSRPTLNEIKAHKRLKKINRERKKKKKKIKALLPTVQRKTCANCQGKSLFSSNRQTDKQSKPALLNTRQHLL